MLNHGGKLNLVAQQFDIPLELWLDLSTGISPFSYPIPDIPELVWRNLPQYNAELIQSAKRYYKANNLIAVSGSQSAIQLLPRYRLTLDYPLSRVWLPKQGYKEHEKAWKDAGFSVVHYGCLAEIQALTQFDIVVVINPNNPTGELTSLSVLTQLHHKLIELQGWLIVDEAFMDGVSTDNSIVPSCDSGNLFVLRSMGKFFGLAGMRVGFLCCAQEHSAALSSMLGPWHLNGPAAFVANLALADDKWQRHQMTRLEQISTDLTELLVKHFGETIQGTLLFKTVYLSDAEDIYIKLCELGVYVRLTDERDALRFGIPTQAQYLVLSKALKSLKLRKVGPVAYNLHVW